ncbi:MAG TPA: ADP-heptose synthase, partial [Chthoniobacterales bacterium]
VIFPDVRATALIEKLKPDVYVKGGDYTVESLNAEERSVLNTIGAEIAFVPLVPGRSTTSTLAKMKSSAE